MMLLLMRTIVRYWAALGALLHLFLIPNAVAASLPSSSLSSSSSSSSSIWSSLPVRPTVNATRPGFNFSVPTNTSSSTALPRNGSEIYKAKFAAHDPKTPKFVNLTGININPLFQAAEALRGKKVTAQLLAARQTGGNGLPVGACAPGTPCVNGACCNNEGWCGFSPEFCSSNVCISNCDAKAQCGPYAPAGKETCPLNVCCSLHGFCGTTEEFCGSNCDNTFGNCGNPPSPSCPAGSQTARRRKIGYYEGWAPTRACDKREPEDLVLSGFTHLNFAFAFFHPTSFQMTAMDDTSAALYSRFTALKKKAAGLQTWISVGGWSFNDETNVPNTRRAFSDMVRTAANRAAFIASAGHFMSAYGFDGIDLDWEYPGSDDRGGRKEDRANLVALLRDMRAAWGNRFGITATLPASYWYLQHFDLPRMEPYLDWFNIMTYDIHGDWDSSNVWAGPYVRPHTNLTEIDLALSLLWRVHIDPSKVVMGLGWYGRSFTLSNPSCNTPWCTFTAGGRPGPCSGESGILSNAEIFRTIAQRGLTPVIDQNAAVAYVSWDDQWVSYDTAQTIATKMVYADEHCLGGSMIWAIDLDDERGTSLGNADSNYRILLSCMFSSCNQNTFGRAPDIKSIYRRSSGGDACYTSFCGAGCEPGYAEVSQMSGDVGTLPTHSGCPVGSWQSLCCATGTQYGSCEWRGYGGFGWACRGGCDAGETEIAQNTNHIEFSDFWRESVIKQCFGGYQTYCCTHFEPPFEMPRLNLIQAEGAYSNWENVEGWSDWRIEQEAASCPDLSVLITSTGARALTEKGISVDLGLVKRGEGSSSHVGLLTTGYLLCFTVNSVYQSVVTGGIKGYAANKIISKGIGLPLGGPSKNTIKNTKAVGNSAQIGPWTKVEYPPGTRDCSTTYFCRYGEGFDQICDNQRYAIEKGLAGRKVYHFPMSGNTGGNRNQVKRWKGWHHKNWKPAWADVDRYGLDPSTSACDIDEFPLNAFVESITTPQILRAIDHRENQKQGTDFAQWKAAIWVPCRNLRLANNKADQPPVTVTWAGIQAGDNRLLPTGVIRKYGFQSNDWQRCLPTATINGQATVVSDHGFRVATTDPLFSATLGALTWTQRSKTWSVDPARIPTTIRRGGTWTIHWPGDVVPISPWLRARGGPGNDGDEEWIALGVDELTTKNNNGTITKEVVGGAIIKQRRSGRRPYLDNEKRRLCHKLFLRDPADSKNLVEALISDEEANSADRCLAAYETDAIQVPATATVRPPSRATTPESSPPESTSEQSGEATGFATIVTTKAAAPAPSSP